MNRAELIAALREEAEGKRRAANNIRMARERIPMKIAPEYQGARQAKTYEAIVAEQDAAHLDRAANILANLEAPAEVSA